MILFIISFLLVFATSYFITCMITPKYSILGLIYMFLTAFAQIVFSFEILSLINGIKPLCVLGVNLMIFDICFYTWYKKSKPAWRPDCKEFKTRVNNSFKLDKALMWLYVLFSC